MASRYATVTVTDCPVSVTLDNSWDRNSIELFRRFRDQVPAKSPDGRKRIQLYYRHAWEASYLFLKHPDLVLQSREMLDLLRPAVEASLEGQSPELGPDELGDIATFLDTVEALGGPSLKKTIEAVRARLTDGSWSLQTANP